MVVILAIMANLSKLPPVEELLCQGEVLNGNGWIVSHVVADHLRCKSYGDDIHSMADRLRFKSYSVDILNFCDTLAASVWHWDG